MIKSIIFCFLRFLAICLCVDIKSQNYNDASFVDIQDKLIYVYKGDKWDLVSRSSLSKRENTEILDNLLNNGAGPVVNHSQGSYHTDQYQLFSLIYNRILTDPRRTLDPSKATSFFIPYDFANDCAFYRKCGKNLENKCFDFRKCPTAPLVETLLAKSPYFKKLKGYDHILIVGMNYAMDHYIGKPKCKSLLRGICRNCTKFAIDDYSFMYGDESGINDRGDNWHAIPFPADFHWSRYVIPPFPWENTERPILVSYVGSGSSHYAPARRLRGSIIYYCEMHPEECVHQTYGANNTRSNFLVEGYNPLELSQRSVFCFQPIGDLMTRKGLFDSLLQGCIPVVFDPLTATVMYTWHWDEEFWKEISIELAFHPIAFRQQDPILYLQDLFVHNRTFINRKLQLIREYVFELQYSLDGKYYGGALMIEKNIPLTWPRYRDGRPMRDAYDIVIDHALGWHSGIEDDYRNATVPECWTGSILDVQANKCIADPKAVKS